MTITSRIKGLVSKQRDAVAAVTGTLGELRNQIASVQQEIERIERLPSPLEDQIAALDLWLDRQVRKAVEFVPINGLVHGQASIELSPQMNGFALLLGACRDPIRDLMLEKLKAHHASHPGMDRATKETKLAKLHDELSQLEIDEETMIREMERGGFEVARRDDASELVVLADEEGLQDK